MAVVTKRMAQKGPYIIFDSSIPFLVPGGITIAGGRTDSLAILPAPPVASLKGVVTNDVVTISGVDSCSPTDAPSTLRSPSGSVVSLVVKEEVELYHEDEVVQYCVVGNSYFMVFSPMGPLKDRDMLFPCC